MVKKPNREYMSRKENTKSHSYILQIQDESYKWDHVKIDPAKNEVNIENVKTEENIKTEQDSNRKEDVQKTIKIFYFSKQESKAKQDHHEDIDKNFIRSLKKLDTSYNPAYINYINDKFKDIMLEEKKTLIHQDHSYFSVILSEYGKPQTLQEARHHKYPV